MCSLKHRLRLPVLQDRPDDPGGLGMAEERGAAVELPPGDGDGVEVVAAKIGEDGLHWEREGWDEWARWVGEGAQEARDAALVWLADASRLEDVHDHLVDL